MNRPHASRHHSLRPVATVLAVAGLLTVATTGNASAQDVGGLKAKAAQISAELDKLQTKAEQLDQQYLSTGEDLTKTQHQIDENKAAVDDAQARMDQASKQAAGYLVSAYMGAGVGSNIALGAGDPNQAVNEKVLLETLQGGQLRVADDLRAARSDLQARSADLAASTKQLTEQHDQQKAIKDQLEAGVSEQQHLLDGTNQQLQAAIQAEQARVAAEQAARVKAEAEAQAARMAAAHRAAQQAAATAAASAAAARAPQAVPPAASRTPGPQTTNVPAGATGPTVPPVAVSGSNPAAARAVAAAMAQLGTPYRWGGSAPGGFDCSGLTLWAWNQAGVSLPRVASAQYAATQRISIDQLQPGDLVFFDGLGHMGMYIGGGMMIHAPHTGDVVRTASIYGGGGSYVGAGRVP